MISSSRLLATALAAACLATCLFASAAQATTPAWAPLAASGPTNLPPAQSEVQQVVVDAEGGSFTLTFNGQTTAAIAATATSSEVEAKLNALSTIGGLPTPGSVTVSGGPGDVGGTSPYMVSFGGGSLANANQPQMVVAVGSLTGPNGHRNALVATVVGGGPGTTDIVFYAQNIGGAPSTGTTTLSFELPEGITAKGTPAGTGWSCLAVGGGESSFNCTTSASAAQGVTLRPVVAPVVGSPTATSGIVDVSVLGGGAVGTATYHMPLVVSAIPAPPGVQAFNAAAYNDDGVFDSRAGAHPYSGSAGILINTKRRANGKVVPSGEFKDIVVDLPPGFLGNPVATPACPEAVRYEFECDKKSIVALVQIPLSPFGSWGDMAGVYNIEAPYGYPGKFRFGVGPEFADSDGVFSKVVVLNALGALRSADDYGLQVASRATPQIQAVYGSFFTFWGTPGSSTHNGQRCTYTTMSNATSGCVSNNEETAFLTNPVNCAEEAVTPPVTTLSANTWQAPELFFERSVLIKPVTECDKLHLEAGFTFEPSDTRSDSTASFKTSLTIPSEGLTKAGKLTTPEIKNSVVQLPKGVVLNASGADGLEACSEQQIGYLGNDFPMPSPIRFDKAPNQCPEASKIGTGELKTALLADPLHGALYLAAQGDGNPYGSLFAIYLVIEDPRHGIFIKLPGKVEPDPATGQMTVTFENLPQLPFTRLDLSLKGGNRSALASPTTCGSFVTTAVNTPWSYPESGPPTESSNGFEINQGPDGGACAKTPQERPFDIGWKAGADGTQAGASSPFSFQITRPDGSQEIDTLSLTTPAGLSASLKGVPYCTEAEIKQAESSTGKRELANPACPGASQVGRLEVGSGSGPSPFYTGGKLYLAGPYKGAPISVVSVVPAVAGPFDLGNVVSRNALLIDRQTAQVTAKSDPIPQILKGVVLRIRDIRIFLNHKDWTLNPTSCEPSGVNLTIHGNSGATAERNARFQVGGCDKLAFKPKLVAKVTGPTKRGELPAFTAELTYPEGPGYANIKDVQVALPHSEFLEQAHINTICTRVQAAANACPQGSIYGYAEAETPLLDGKLTGPVFLKSSDHQLPDLAIALKGPANQPVEVEFQGRIDSVHGQIRNTIEGLPDVPVSKFVLKMKGGKKGLLVNSRNLCQGKPGRMTVKMGGQNGTRLDTRPRLGNSCGGKDEKQKKSRKAKSSRFSLHSPGALW